MTDTTVASAVDPGPGGTIVLPKASDLFPDAPPALPKAADLFPDQVPARGMKGMPAYPQAVLDRLKQGDAITPVIKAAAEGAAQGWGPGFLLSPEHAQQLADPKNWDGALRTLGSVAGAGIATVTDTLQRLASAGVGAIQGGVTQAGKEAGLARPESLGQDVGAYIGIEMARGGPFGEVYGVTKNLAGGWIDRPVGEIPTREAAAGQASQIAEHFGQGHEMAGAIMDTYEQTGRTPAEVHVDMGRDPAVLGDVVAGEVPQAYPVSDWTGGAAEPQAARAEAPSTAPTPTPTGPTRLRPITDTAERTVSGLAESVEASAVNKELVANFGDLPELGVAKDATQGPKAVALLDKDPDLAMAIAMGQKQAPPGMLASAVYVAVKNRAEAAGDVETLRQLGTQSQFLGQVRRMGQEVSYLRNVNPEADPVAAINQVQAARQEALKARGVDVSGEVEKIVQEASAVARQTRAAKPPAWDSFIKSITCAEG